MFNSTALAAKSAASRLPQLFLLSKSTALSATLLLALMPSVQAAVNNANTTTANNTINNSKKTSITGFADIFKSRATSCDNGIATQDIATQTVDTKQPNHQNSQRQSLRRQQLDCMLTQLRVYQQPDNHSSRQQYFAYKAQAWLNYASHEDSINSRSAAGEQALQSGITILQALQNDSDENLSLTNDIPSTSALMRPDLWATLSGLKDSDGITVAPRELAFSEVALIWAAANHCEHGSRQSGPQFRMADRWLEQAREAYINVHDSKTNVALGELINSYYKQFAPLDPNDDGCHGQVLPLESKTPSTQTLSISNKSRLSFAQTITMPMPIATYHIVD